MQKVQNSMAVGICLMAIFFLLFTVGDIHAGIKGVSPKRKSRQPSKGRAVSLGALQERVKECLEKSERCDSILLLCGLKEVDGFVVDAKNKDVILFGKTNATSPPIYLDDFIIALRNVWWKYASIRGHTYYYSPPGCSIDPDPETIARLKEIVKRISSTSGDIKGTLKKWHLICRRPQKVKVYGVPFYSRFAKVMVDADYYMKRLVDGSVSLDIEGFVSVTEMSLREVKKGILEGKSASMSPCLNRFWFFPGKNQYLVDEGIVLIKQCKVRLLTEEEFLTREGKIAGKGHPNLLAQRFAESFTAQYKTIARKKPIYTELKNLFRFVALAKIMRYEDVLSQAQLNLDYFLDHYSISKTPVSKTLPGISHVKKFEHREDLAGGYQIVKAWVPSCGGVCMDIKITKKDVVRDRGKTLLELRKSILDARPPSEAVYWDY